jgi:hypothetical protein
LCREGIGGPLSAHPDYLGKYLNARQLREWSMYETLEPFDTERGDARSSLEIFWARQTWVENHNASPDDYRLKFEEPEQNEATELMNEVREIFGL